MNPNQPKVPVANNVNDLKASQQSAHVYDGDRDAEFIDRRNQVGQAFDDNVNEHTTMTELPRSTSVNDMNRYQDVENVQLRTINRDGSIPSTGSE